MQGKADLEGEYQQPTFEMLCVILQQRWKSLQHLELDIKTYADSAGVATMAVAEADWNSNSPEKPVKHHSKILMIVRPTQPDAAGQ